VTGSTQELAAAHAWDAARRIEKRLASRDPAELDLLTEACEVDAHPDGSLGIVLDVRGPHVALILGRGEPFVEVWWGGAVGSEAVDLNHEAVARFVATWWRPEITNASGEGCEERFDEGSAELPRP
jgi:hypothetical protein